MVPSCQLYEPISRQLAGSYGGAILFSNEIGRYRCLKSGRRRRSDLLHNIAIGRLSVPAEDQGHSKSGTNNHTYGNAHDSASG